MFGYTTYDTNVCFLFLDSLDTLEQRVRNLFSGCRRGDISLDQAQIELMDIQRNYDKTAEEADEKVALATQMHDLVNRYIKKLG